MAANEPPETRINPQCAERFEEAGLHDYHPSCCRFPKSCSAIEVCMKDVPGIFCRVHELVHSEGSA